MPDAVAKLQPPSADGPPSRHGRSFAVVAVGLTVLVLASTMALAVTVDPRNELGGPLAGSPFQPLVADWPAQKLEPFEEVQPAPTALVLGTSRGMPVPPDALATGTVSSYNLAFPGSEAVNVRALYEHLVEEGKRPDRVVYALDQWSVRDHREDRVIGSRVAGDLGEPVPGLGDKVGRLAATLSVPYVRDVARSARYAFVDGYPSPGITFGPSGEMHMAAFEGEARATYDQAGAIHAGLAELDSAFSAKRSVDPEAVAALDAFLTEAAANGTLVQVFLPPFHPDALAHVQALPRYAAFVQVTRATLLEHCGPLLQVHDFTDPASIDADPADFYDSHHSYASTGRRIVAALDADQGDLCAGPASP